MLALQAKEKLQTIERDVDSELLIAREEYKSLFARREALLEELKISEDQIMALEEQALMEIEDALTQELQIKEKIAENERLIASYPTEQDVDDAKSKLEEIEKEIERCTFLHAKISEVLLF